MNYYFCGFYRCVNSGESLTVKALLSGFTQFASVLTDKIHKNKIYSYINLSVCMSQQHFSMSVRMAC